MLQITSDDYQVLIAAYDPRIHGSQKAYCQQLGINYANFRKRICRQKRKAGIPARPMTNYGPYLAEFENSDETIKEFCQNRGLKEKNFRMALYRHGYRLSEDERRSKAKQREKEAAWLESIFTGEEAFFEVVPQEEKPSC